MFAAHPDGLLYKLFAALLDYPEHDLTEGLQDARRLVRDARVLPVTARTGLERFLDYLGARDLLTLQENYVALFDRGRATSLHLFEHVHGESRERGQAMIDLKTMYERQGLFLQPGQLPDYLPVFLEYLSTLSPVEARKLLGETAAILQSLYEQLTRRDSHYAYVIGALLPLAGVRDAPLPEAAGEDDADILPDEATLRSLDEAYADEPVRFVGAPTPAVPAISPVQFHARRPAR